MIRRVEYEVTVDGANKAADGFDDVAAAEGRAARAAQSLDTSLRRVEASGRSVAAVTPRVGASFGDLLDPVGKTLTVFNDIGDVFKLFAAGIAGGALFGGLQDIAEAFKAIQKAAKDAMSGVDLSLGTTGAKALDIYAAKAKEAAEAERELQKAIADRYAEQERGASSVAERTLRAIGPGATDEAIREALQVGENLTRAQQGLKDALSTAAAKGGLGVTDNDIARVRDYQERVEASERAVRNLTQLSQAVPRAPSVPAPSLADVVGGIAGAPSPRRAMESEALAGIDRELAAGAPAVEQADAVLIGMQQHAMMAGHAMQTVQTEAAKTRDIMAEMWTGTKDAFAGMAESAMNVGGIVVQALSTMTSAVGSMMTNIIISGEAGAKGVAKAAGNALAGISAQAFGYSVLLGALAAAASLAGPILGLQAGGFAAAAGVMAAAGGGLAVTARLLGADKLGGGAAGRGGAGGSPGGYGAATATNPYGGPGQQGTTVQVYIDGEQVTRAVRVREQRMALSGGIMGGA